MLKLLLLFLFFQDPLPPETPAELCGGEIQVTKHPGDPVELCGTLPADDPTFIYARARASQSQNGNYEIIAKIPVDQMEIKPIRDGRLFWVITYKYTARFTQHWFLNAVYSRMDGAGNPVLTESPGSNHAKAEVVP